METLTGILLVVSAGLLIGSLSWPMKVCPNLSFGHMWLSGMVAGLLVAPWLIALLGVPNLFAAYAEVPLGTLLKANLFSLAWGIANVLFGISVTRIGASLSMAILTGIGASLGVTLPMILKGSGLFAGAPSIVSMPGAVVLLGVVIMLVGVVLCARSGRLRESAVVASAAPQGSYATNMLIIMIGGVLSAGISFTFIFSQDEIVRAVTAQGAGPVAANASVWAIALLAGMLVNVVYPAVLIAREGSWAKFVQYPGQIFLSALIGIQFFTGRPRSELRSEIRSLLCICALGSARMTFELIPAPQRGSQSAAGISRRGLDPEILERPFAEQAAVGDAIQRDAAGQTEAFQLGLTVRMFRQLEHNLLGH